MGEGEGACDILIGDMSTQPSSPDGQAPQNRHTYGSRTGLVLISTLLFLGTRLLED